MIKLIVLDVDGCLTDGKITYDANGIESKSFNVKDGLAIRTFKEIGAKVAIITGRSSSIVQKRAQELKIDHLRQGIRHKLEALTEICNKEGIGLDEVAAIGDDLNDYAMLNAVKLSFTPADGALPIRALVDVVLEHRGGEGAVREMIEYIVKQNDQEREFLAFWL